MSSPTNGKDGSPPVTKGIGSLARKPSDLTRGGMTKMRFTPTLPGRKKKNDNEPKKEDAASSESSPRGRGRGRGGITRETVKMMASGPFAMGPVAASSSSSKKGALRGNPTVAPSTSGVQKPASPTSKSTARKAKADSRDEGTEVYSDADDGVDIVDIHDVKGLDWMSPDVLKRAVQRDRLPMKLIPEAGDTDKTEMNVNNALDLSESDEEEDTADLAEHFSSKGEDMDVDNRRQEQLCFLQFPAPFPIFKPREIRPIQNGHSTSSPAPSSLQKGKGKAVEGSKRVSFADDSKPPVEPDGDASMGESAETTIPAVPTTSGRIGQLEIHASGAVKMRLDNGLMLDVTTATRASFPQHAVRVDPATKRIVVLGEIDKRFIASPDLECLLEAVRKSQ